MQSIATWMLGGILFLWSGVGAAFHSRHKNVQLGSLNLSLYFPVLKNQIPCSLNIIFTTQIKLKKLIKKINKFPL